MAGMAQIPVPAVPVPPKTSLGLTGREWLCVGAGMFIGTLMMLTVVQLAGRLPDVTPSPEDREALAGEARNADSVPGADGPPGDAKSPEEGSGEARVDAVGANGDDRSPADRKVDRVLEGLIG